MGDANLSCVAPSLLIAFIRSGGRVGCGASFCFPPSVALYLKMSAVTSLAKYTAFSLACISGCLALQELILRSCVHDHVAVPLCMFGDSHLEDAYCLIVPVDVESLELFASCQYVACSIYTVFADGVDWRWLLVCQHMMCSI